MKGLDLHRAFFAECGQPLLAEAFPAELEVLAVASVGWGSDRLGADDEHSRDHCWEPGMQIFSGRLEPERLAEIETFLFERLPWEFAGFKRTDCEHSPNGIRAWTIDEFFESMTGVAQPPADDSAWLGITEEALFHVTNGEVFHDPAGDFTARRDAFGSYPPNVQAFKLAGRAHRVDVGRYGLERTGNHGETVAAEIILADGIREVMKFAFLANRRYAPIDRWLAWGFRRLPLLAPAICPLVEATYETRDWPRRRQLYQQMIDVCAAWTAEEGLTTGGEFWWRELQERIQGPLATFPPPSWVGAEFGYGTQFALGGDFRKLYGQR